MRNVYMTALSPVQGSEGDLTKFLNNCTLDFGWHSPLPLMIPLSLWTTAFPRDRVNRKGLKTLPALELSGPVIKLDHIILQMNNTESFANSEMFREIHGKTVPPRQDKSFINWKGLLLHPSGMASITHPFTPFPSPDMHFQFNSWQLGLFQLTFDETRNWWEDLRVKNLWNVRKPS